MAGFLFVKGQYAGKNECGVVADRCDHCGRLSRFAVVEHHTTEHVFFIPTGDKKVHTLSKRCLSCGAESACGSVGVFSTALGGYSRVLLAEAADKLTLEELLRETNPYMAQVEEARREAAAVAREDPEAVQRADELIHALTPTFPQSGGMLLSLLLTALVGVLLFLSPLPVGAQVGGVIALWVFGWPIIFVTLSVRSRMRRTAPGSTRP